MGKNNRPSRQQAKAKSAETIAATTRLWSPFWRFFAVEQMLERMSQEGYRLVNVERANPIKHVYHFARCTPERRKYYVVNNHSIPPKSFSEVINPIVLHRDRQEMAPLCERMVCNWAHMSIAELKESCDEGFLVEKKLLRLKAVLRILLVYLIPLIALTVLYWYVSKPPWLWSLIQGLPLFLLTLYFAFAVQNVLRELKTTKKDR